MNSTYKTQSTHGGDYTPSKPLGAIDISIDGRSKEIFIDAYEGQGSTYKLRDKPLINLFDKSILVFAGNTDELFKHFITPEYAEDIAALFAGMIDRAKQIIYTEEFKRSEEYHTEETNLKTLGILVSKFCKWDIGNIVTVYDAALEDSNANPVTEARELLRIHGYVVDGLWSKDDISPRAEEMGIHLTPEQVDNIFSKMGKFDAELGINWDFIENLIQEEVNPIDHSVTI
ncbi:MAG TPA: hypothetical protein PLP63_06705 [Saprospiraceae bacterium]|nr:hypothetical protein [Saprospiraceae bacterium]